MIRSAVSSLSTRFVRNGLPNSSQAGSSWCSSELLKNNDFSNRVCHSYSSRPLLIHPTKLPLCRHIPLNLDPRHPMAFFATDVASSPSSPVEETTENGESPEEGDVALENSTKGAEVARVPPPKLSDKDRSKVIPVETSMRYLQSDAYKQSYGDTPVWVLYRRNFKGQFAPKKTRKTCIRQQMLTTGNACPICRDEYLVLDYRNIDLLKQFISPYNGEILSYSQTGLCQKRHTQLLVAVMKAKDYGYISFDVPVREYDYSEYEHLYKSYREA